MYDIIIKNGKVLDGTGSDGVVPSSTPVSSTPPPPPPSSSAPVQSTQTVTKYNVEDPDNTRGLSTQKFGFCFRCCFGRSAA